MEKKKKKDKQDTWDCILHLRSLVSVCLFVARDVSISTRGQGSGSAKFQMSFPGRLVQHKGLKENWKKYVLPICKRHVDTYL